MERDVIRVWWVGLSRWLAIAVLVSVVLSLLTSAALIGLPHGWETATSWADITLRSSWFAGYLVPVAVAVHLLMHLRRRRQQPGPDRYRPSSFKRGGGHS